MAFEDLEKIYEMLAQMLDQVGTEKHSLFLAKLTMILAHRIGDPRVVEEALHMAAKDVDEEEGAT